MYATMKRGINHGVCSITRPAIQQMVNMPAQSPTAPPATSTFSLITIPCAISANGTITSANTDNIDHVLIPFISIKPRHISADIIALYPTVDQIREVRVSEYVFTPFFSCCLLEIIGVPMPPIIHIRNHSHFQAGL